MGLFGNLGKASFTGRDPFFPKQFEGTVEVQSCSFYESKDPGKDGVHFFKVVAKVLTAHYPDGKIPSDGLRPGQNGVHLMTLGTAKQIQKAESPAMGDVKAFLEAGYRQMAINARANGNEDADPNSIDSSGFGDAEADPVYGPSQVFAGLVLGLKTQVKPTKNDGEFTQHFWTDLERFSPAFPAFTG